MSKGKEQNLTPGKALVDSADWRKGKRLGKQQSDRHIEGSMYRTHLCRRKEVIGKPLQDAGMNENKTITPIIIAVSGTSGSGKTTLTRRLSALLPRAVSVHFDDFAASHQILPDIDRWIAGGCDPAN